MFSFNFFASNEFRLDDNTRIIFLSSMIQLLRIRESIPIGVIKAEQEDSSHWLTDFEEQRYPP
jgi:hypothetical protein